MKNFYHGQRKKMVFFFFFVPGGRKCFPVLKIEVVKLQNQNIFKQINFYVRKESGNFFLTHFQYHYQTQKIDSIF